MHDSIILGRTQKQQQQQRQAQTKIAAPGKENGYLL